MYKFEYNRFWVRGYLQLHNATKNNWRQILDLK